MENQIIFVSHFPDEVERICEKAILLEQREIGESGQCKRNLSSIQNIISTFLIFDKHINES